jgi:hypothetical protein
MSWCKLEPLYKDEPKNYHLLSTCLFIKEKYIKTTYGKVEDVSEKRQKSFINAIEQYAILYNKGYWNDKTRLRIYFDKSLDINENWSIVLNKYMKHPFFQWIRYDIPSKKDPNNNNYHIGLIGTLIRFHPLFVKNSSIRLISIIDLDIVYTSKWREEIDKFSKSKYDMQCFSNMFSIPFYGSLIDGITEEKPHGYWISAGLLTSKVILPYTIWNNLLDYVRSRRIMNKLRYLDALKIALYNNNMDKFMEDFEYGLDEILLNDIIGDYINKNEIKLYVTEVLSKPDVNFIRDKMKIYMKWNAIKTTRMINLYKAMGIKTYEDLVKEMDNKKTIKEFIKMFKNRDILDIMEKLQIDKRIIYIIKNYDENKFNKYNNIKDYIQNI